MKKLILLLPLLATLFACGNDPMYTTCKKTTFGFDNEGNSFVFDEEVFENLSITNYRNDKGILIKDDNSDFGLQVIQEPPQVVGKDFDGDSLNFTHIYNYKIGMKTSNDTLYLLYGPTDQTPSETPKIGLQYVFYK